MSRSATRPLPRVIHYQLVRTAVQSCLVRWGKLLQTVSFAQAFVTLQEILEPHEDKGVLELNFMIPKRNKEKVTKANKAKRSSTWSKSDTDNVLLITEQHC